MLYFVTLDTPSGDWPIKIGYGRDEERVASHVKSFQVASPYPVRVLATVGIAGRSVESAMHRAFASSRLSGEWFERTPPLMRYIKWVQAHPEATGSEILTKLEQRKAAIERADKEGREYHPVQIKRARKSVRSSCRIRGVDPPRGKAMTAAAIEWLDQHEPLGALAAAEQLR